MEPAVETEQATAEQGHHQHQHHHHHREQGEALPTFLTQKTFRNLFIEMTIAFVWPVVSMKDRKDEDSNVVNEVKEVIDDVVYFH